MTANPYAPSKLRTKQGRYETGFCNTRNHLRCNSDICTCPCHTQQQPDLFTTKQVTND